METQVPHIFLSICNQQKKARLLECLCANVPKGAPQQLQCVYKKQIKIKWLQTINSVKLTFTQKQILRPNGKL